MAQWYAGTQCRNLRRVEAPAFMDAGHARPRELKAGLATLTHKCGVHSERGVGLLPAVNARACQIKATLAWPDDPIAPARG